jgi:ubiquinone/menaquinone biosynthesis C-methylase UbiE
MKSDAPSHFDGIASQYATSEVHSGSPTIRRLLELLAPKPPVSVCDLACGPGHLALAFAGRAGRIVGVDAAPNMLREFEKLAAGRGVTVETVHAWAETVPFPDQTFDIVVSRLAPHHFPDAAKAVREMARLTKSGGRVAVIDLEGHADPVADALNHDIEVLHDASHGRSYTVARWRELFEASGLVIEALEPKQSELPSGLSVRRWCEQGSTPPAAEAAIRARLAAAPPEQLAALGIRYENGEFYQPVRTLLILGRKG